MKDAIDRIYDKIGRAKCPLCGNKKQKNGKCCDTCSEKIRKIMPKAQPIHYDRYIMQYLIRKQGLPLLEEKRVRDQIQRWERKGSR